MPIRKHGNRWQVRVAAGGGRRIERTLPVGASRADARRLENALTRRQIESATGTRPDRLIDEAISEWLPAARALKSWQHDVRYRLAVLQADYTPGKRVSALPDVAQAVIRRGHAAGLSPAGINRYLAILRRLANLVVKWGWTDVPLGRRIDLVPGETQRDALLTPEQVLMIARHAGPLVGDLILFAALTGLRRGELLSLTPDRIRNGAIVLTAKTKSGKPRIVPMTPQAAEIAANRLPWQITARELTSAFVAARTAAGLPNVRLHDCRHAFGSWLAESGASVADIRDLMGHSSVAVTSRYLHARREALAASVAKLPDLRVNGGTENP